MNKAVYCFHLPDFSHVCVRILICLALVCCPLSAYGATEKEDLVKAVVIYNFAKFTDWPEESFEDPSAPIVFTSIGENMKKTLTQFEGRQIKNRSLALGHFEYTPEYYSHVIYISSREEKEVKKVLELVKNKPILTVSDIPGFIDIGGMIGLLKEEGRIRFEINFDATQKAGLKVSSQLLLLATKVLRDQGEGK